MVKCSKILLFLKKIQMEDQSKQLKGTPGPTAIRTSRRSIGPRRTTTLPPLQAANVSFQIVIVVAAGHQVIATDQVVDLPQALWIGFI